MVSVRGGGQNSEKDIPQVYKKKVSFTDVAEDATSAACGIRVVMSGPDVSFIA